MASTTIYTCDVCGEEADRDGLLPISLGIQLEGAKDPWDYCEAGLWEKGSGVWPEVCGPCRSEAIRFLKARRSRASGRIDA